MPILGAVGALIAEIIKQWERFGKMPPKRFWACLRSPKTVAAALVLMLVGALSAWFLTHRITDPTPELGFFSGLGAMSLLRQTLAGAAANKATELGPADEVNWRDVL